MQQQLAFLNKQCVCACTVVKELQDQSDTQGKSCPLHHKLSSMQQQLAFLNKQYVCACTVVKELQDQSEGLILPCFNFRFKLNIRLFLVLF